MTAPAIQQEERPCPKCGGRTWDNRVGKKNPKAPDFKCRDKSCDGVIWPPRGGAASFAPRQGMQTPLPNTKQPHSIGLTGNALLDEQTASEDKTFAELQAGEEWVTLKRRYLETLDFVLKKIAPMLEGTEVGTDPSSIAAIAATLFIERNRRGV